MSSLNTTTLNNTLKAQQLSGKKALQETAQTASNTGFENLFANALSQRANPQAKLSMINEELQEALGGSTSRSSEGNKKPFNASENNANTDINANPYGMSSNTLAQANMWAQRDWAQSNRAESPAVTSSAASTSSSNTVQTQAQTQNANSNSNSVAQNRAESASTPEAQAKPAQESAAASATEPGTTTQDAKASADAGGQSTTGARTDAASDSDAAPAVSTEQNASNNATAKLATDAAANLSITAEPGTETAAATNATSVTPQSTETNTQASTPQGSSAEAQTKPLNAANEFKTDNAQIDPSARQTSEGKTEVSTAGLKPQLETSGANNPTNQATRPDLAQTAAAMQAQQASNGKASGSARSLKAGDEILATSGTNSSTSGSTASSQANAGIGLAGMATGRTGSAAEATIKTPVNQPGFVKELGAQVQWAVGKNLSTVDIRLSAGQMGADAGSMNMRIIQRGQDIQLVIRTQDEATANMLNQTIAGLKETMAQNGLQLTQVQIQTGNNPNNPNAAGNSSLANAQQQAQQQADQSGNNAGGQSGRQGSNTNGKANSDGQAEVAEPQRRNRSNGNIDLVA